MDLDPIFQPMITSLWYLIPVILIGGLIKSPWFKGKVGEFLVNFSARHFLDKNDYHLIKNVTLPTEDGTTQIDQIIVSRYGVFVVETKNMKGWIFGNARQKFWTQKIFRHSQKFQNPLHQNYKHVKNLQSLLGLSDQQIHSVVVFVGSSSFKTPMPENVTQGMGYIRYIRTKKEPVLSLEQVADVQRKLASGRLKASFATDRAHARYVRGLVAERYGVSPSRSSGRGLKLMVLFVALIGVWAIALNELPRMGDKAMAIAMKHSQAQQVKHPSSTAPRQPESQPTIRSVTQGSKPNVQASIQRVPKPPSELSLARQECNARIAGALGSQDPRILRVRDKACARYKQLAAKLSGNQR